MRHAGMKQGVTIGVRISVESVVPNEPASCMRQSTI